MYLLDTNVLSELRQGKRGQSRAVVAWARRVPLTQHYISCITLYELEAGVLAMERRDVQQGQRLRAWLSALQEMMAARVLPVDAAVASRCAALQVPDRMPEMDALIAATALVHGMTLVTRNTADFHRSGVRLVDPWADEDAT